MNEEQALAVTSKALLTEWWEPLGTAKKYMVIIYGMRQTWSEGDGERERERDLMVGLFFLMIYDKISMVFCCGIVLVGNT